MTDTTNRPSTDFPAINATIDDMRFVMQSMRDKTLTSRRGLVMAKAGFVHSKFVGDDVRARVLEAKLAKRQAKA